MANWDELNTATTPDISWANVGSTPAGKGMTGSLSDVMFYFPGSPEQVVQDFIASHPGTTYDPNTQTFTMGGQQALDLGRGGKSNLFDKFVMAGLGAGFGTALGGAMGFDPFGAFSSGTVPSGTSALSDNYWNMLAGDAPSGGMSGLDTSAISGGTGLDATTALGDQTAGSWAGQTAATGDVLAGTPAAGGTGAGIGTTGFGGAPATMSTATSNPLTQFLNYAGTTPGQVASTAYNLWSQQQMRNQLAGAAGQALQAGQAPINQAQRLPYQADLLSLISNPQDFFRTNPLFLAQSDQARQAFQAQAAKSGMGGTSINDYMANIMNVGAGTYNQQVQNLAGLGGFAQGGGTAGGAFGPLTTGAVGQGGAGIAGVAPLINTVAGSQAGTDAYSSIANLFSSQASPVSGASTVNV